MGVRSAQFLLFSPFFFFAGFKLLNVLVFHTVNVVATSSFLWLCWKVYSLFLPNSSVFQRANKPLIFHSNWLIVCPRSNLLRDSNIILINLLDSLAICTFVGHRSLTNFSSFVRSLKSGSIDDIFPKRQFLSISNIGQSRKIQIRSDTHIPIQLQLADCT